MLLRCGLALPGSALRGEDELPSADDLAARRSEEGFFERCSDALLEADASSRNPSLRWAVYRVPLPQMLDANSIRYAP